MILLKAPEQLLNVARLFYQLYTEVMKMIHEKEKLMKPAKLKLYYDC